MKDVRDRIVDILQRIVMVKSPCFSFRLVGWITKHRLRALLLLYEFTERQRRHILNVSSTPVANRSENCLIAQTPFKLMPC